MKTKSFLLFVSLIFLIVFVIFSYTVAKEVWNQVDFDTTVKLQDRIPRKFDKDFSYFSLLGSAEVIFSLSIILAILSLFRKRFLAFIGWLLVIPASFIEIYGKLVLYHPGTPIFLHRSLIETNLPSFYVQTKFSYPSGHMLRTTFILTILIVVVVLKYQGLKRFILVGALLFGVFMMSLTRIYLGEHWLSDVLGGILLGISAGLFSAIFIIRIPKTAPLQV